MVTISGTYNTAIIYTDIIEEAAAAQIKQLCDQEFVKGCRIRIMPDVHAGSGCVIGFTADLGDMVIPNIVGVDIGCGMLTVELGKIDIDFKTLDNIIRTYVPSGMNVHKESKTRFAELQNLHCYRELKETRWLERSIGTLGGGNHFIEVDVDDENNQYLVIHTGSRNLGKQVAEHYQNLAYDIHLGKDRLFEEKQRIIKEYKEAGRRTEIEEALKTLSRSYEEKEATIPKELCYLTGEFRQMYLDDMRICQRFAVLNRLIIAQTILSHLLGATASDFSYFETIHNYIDHDSNFVRKGAVSAKAGEKLLIPINMRDGSLICVGKGNDDWNCSAPHGAGRRYSRTAAKDAFTIEQFKAEMSGIFTTSVSSQTLDECPMAYKSMEEIISNISPTVDIVKKIKPVYNFKAE